MSKAQFHDKRFDHGDHRAHRPKARMTAHAERAATIASLVETTLKTVGYLYMVKLSVPEDTTGGGIRVLQHLQLVPIDGSPLVVGHVNTKESTAALRSLAHMRLVNQNRFDGELPIDSLAYATFLENAEKLFTDLGFTVSITPPPPETPRSAWEQTHLRLRHLPWATWKVWASSPARPWAFAVAALMLAGVVTWALVR